MADTYKEILGRINHLQNDKIKPLLEKGYEHWSADEVDTFQQLNAELADLNAKRDQAKEIEAAISDMQRKGEMPADVLPHQKTVSAEKGESEFTSIGDYFIKSDAFTKFDRMTKQGPTVELEIGHLLEKGVNFKTLFETTDYPSRDVRLPGFLEYPRRRLVVSDLIPQGTTSAASISYVAELEGTNAAAGVLEGGEKPESALSFEERTAAVRKIATVLPITDESLEDEPFLRSYINSRLAYFIQYEEEEQLVRGAGGADLTGILNTVGIQTQAKGTDPTPDAVMKAMTKIQVNAKFQPSGIVMHPNDWQEVRLLKTADGVYIWGSPADEGPMRMWGLPVVPSEAMSEGTAIVGAWNVASQIFRRSGLAFAMSDSHSDYFIKNKVMIRCEERLAYVVFRPAAFATVTGI